MRALRHSLHLGALSLSPISAPNHNGAVGGKASLPVSSETSQHLLGNCSPSPWLHYTRPKLHWGRSIGKAEIRHCFELGVCWYQPTDGECVQHWLSTCVVALRVFHPTACLLSALCEASRLLWCRSSFILDQCLPSTRVIPPLFPLPCPSAPAETVFPGSALPPPHTLSATASPG